VSFISVLKTIGEDIEKGIQIAEPIIGTFLPAAGPLLTELAAIIAALENIGSTPANTNITPLTQAVATISAVKQFSTKTGSSGG